MGLCYICTEIQSQAYLLESSLRKYLLLLTLQLPNTTQYIQQNRYVFKEQVSVYVKKKKKNSISKGVRPEKVWIGQGRGSSVCRVESSGQVPELTMTVLCK